MVALDICAVECYQLSFEEHSHHAQRIYGVNETSPRPWSMEQCAAMRLRELNRRPRYDEMFCVA